MYLLGIAGKARSGKDLAARYFRDQHKFNHIAFADPLKRMASMLTQEPEHTFHHDVLKEQEVPWLGMTRRRVLQILGNDAIKPYFGPDIWARVMEQRLLGPLKSYNSIVISDVRFNEEAEMIHRLGGHVLQLQRDAAGLSGDAGAHSSEAGVSEDLIDFHIDNNGTVGELCHELDKIAAYVRGGK